MTQLIKVNANIYDAWLNWIKDPPCCPPCNGCWKTGGGYHRRSEWLTEWMTHFISNESAIAQGLKRMPELNWCTNHEANRVKQNLEQCHKNRCIYDSSYNDCHCSYAVLLREVWGKDRTDEYGVQEILGRYTNLLKQK